MCCHQTLNGLLKHCPIKLNKAPCTICYTEKTKTFPKGTTVGTINLKPGEFIHMDVSSYNVTSIHGFTSILTVVCAKTIILLVFHTASKLSLVRIIPFILITLNNEQHPCKRIRVDEDGALEKSTDVTN